MDVVVTAAAGGGPWAFRRAEVAVNPPQLRFIIHHSLAAAAVFSSNNTSWMPWTNFADAATLLLAFALLLAPYAVLSGFPSVGSWQCTAASARQFVEPLRLRCAFP